jgi:uncharacterized protein (TIGR00730 family)
MAKVRSLCVYCGAARDAGSNETRIISESHIDQALRLGKHMADRGVTLVYGGGRYSMMKAIADGVADNGGHVIGVMPEFLDRVEGFYEKCHELIKTKNMHSRKQKFFELSDGYIILPGGLGTVEELAEVHKWKQLRMHNKPIIIVNVDGFWNSYINLMKDIIYKSYTEKEALDMLTIVDDVDEIFPAIEKEPDIRNVLTKDMI